MAANGRNFKLYRYTDDDGNNWSLRVETTVGADANYGFGAYNAADKMFIRSPRNQPRHVVLMDPDTGRTVTRPVGAKTGDAWDTSPFTEDIDFPGKADPVEYVRIRKVQERLVNRDQTQRNLAEPDDDAP